MGHHVYGIRGQVLLLSLLFILQIQLGNGYSRSNISCTENERNALLRFREGLIDRSTRLSSWIGDDCCAWDGVGCDQSTNHVFRLDLLGSYGGNDSLRGVISPSLVDLEHLQFLDLSGNELGGTIPSGIGQLKKLQSLDLYGNSLIGTLSELHFANLTELRFLRIASSLLTLNVSSHWVPPFQLQHINMNSIQIGPRFPQWLQTQKNVLQLHMSDAGISDKIPDWFEIAYSGVHHLDLSGNQISGVPPNFKFGDPSDEYKNYGRQIFLQSNKFDGSFKSFSPRITVLALSNNSLTGQLPLPDDNMSVSSLIGFWVNDNNFTGDIPSQICKLLNLNYLDLSSNQLSGRIPSCLGNLRNLRQLNLGNNSFFGLIPSSLGNLVNLLHLQLGRNRFHGTLPSSIQNLALLRILDLGENQLEDFIPAWLGAKFIYLAFIRLQSNRFHGDIPVNLCQLSSLQVLNLAHNRLTGPIPVCFKNLRAMASYHPVYYIPVFFYPLFYNPMKGSDLEYSTNLGFLQSITLSGNNLSGEIPAELTDLIALRSLHLSDNHFQGRISEKIGDLKQLESLDLSMNELSGPIPLSLTTIDSLGYLNLSFNKLSGRIPQGKHFQTLDNPSIYQGNIELCGKPLNNCPDDESEGNNGSPSHFEGEGGEKFGFMLVLDLDLPLDWLEFSAFFFSRSHGVMPIFESWIMYAIKFMYSLQ